MTQEVDWISSQAWVRFYNTYAKSNPHKLLLQFGNKTPEERFFAEQLAARAKAIGKWEACWFDQHIIFPPPISVEQASSSATARYKATLVNGVRGIDITGGFGIDSFAFSHRFKEWIYVERNEQLCERAAHNFKQLNRHNIEVICGDGPEVALTISGPIDLIFADPSRRVGGQKVIHTTTYEPDLSKFHQQFLKQATAVLYKLSPMADIQEQIQLFQSESSVTVVAYNKECKEILMHWQEALS
jgi:protein-L-isoaspartate O-methyltransferase